MEAEEFEKWLLDKGYSVPTDLYIKDYAYTFKRVHEIAEKFAESQLKKEREENKGLKIQARALQDAVIELQNKLNYIVSQNGSEILDEMETSK